MQIIRIKSLLHTLFNVKNINRLFGIFPYILLLFFLFSFTFQSDLSFNQDLGMHLILGKIIWQTHNVPNTNLFSYTNPTFPFINSRWLFEVLAYFGSITIGIEGMLVVKIIILLASLLMILFVAKTNKSVLLLPISFIFLHLMRDRVDLRPEIFSYLFTAVTLFVLDRFSRVNSKLIYLLPCISFLWVNSHIYFPIGILMQLIFLIDLIIQTKFKKTHTQSEQNKIKILFIVCVLSIVATLLNPNFIKGALYPLTLFNNFGVSIVVENQPIFVQASLDPKNHDYLFFYLSLMIVIGSFITILIKEKFSFKNICLALLGLALAIQSIKGLPYLILISLPAVLSCFDFVKNTIWIKILNGIIAVLILIEATFYLSGVYYTLTYKPNNATLTAIADEKSAIDFLIAHNLPQPIYNIFNTGSYLLYRTYPKYKVFVDERLEAYPPSFFQNNYFPMQQNYVIFKQEDKKYGFKTILFNITSQGDAAVHLLNALNNDPNWKVVFLDQYMIIFVTANEQEKLQLPEINLSKLNIDDYRYRNVTSYTNLSDMLFNLNYFKEAKTFNQKALAISPDNPSANLIMASILLKLNEQDNNLINVYFSKSNGIFW